VVLENDMRTDDAEGLIAAIGCMRGVLSVAKEVSDISAWAAQERARHNLGEKLWCVLYPSKP
jgi:hypothetical protein